MPLFILAPLIVVGLIAVVAAVHYSGRAKPFSGLNSASAQERFLVDYPGASITQIHASAGGDLVLLELESPTQIGIVRSMGANSLTRLLEAKSLDGYQRATNRIELQLKDFTLPRLAFEGNDEALGQIERALTTMKADAA